MAANLAGRWGPTTGACPVAVYTRPVLAAVGHTEASPAPPGSTRSW
jgi:pyruvate/2-oxoglutarate dehydrogenase complex dihydrolipoamide dehydrogenase (E3) component